MEKVLSFSLINRESIFALVAFGTYTSQQTEVVRGTLYFDPVDLAIDW